MFPDSFIPKFQKFYAPPDIPNVGSVGSKSESQAVEELIGGGDDETNEDEDAEDEDAEGKGSEEDAETDDEDAEDDALLEDEDLTKDLGGAYGPVDKKALLAKYPKLFKDFPELGKTFQREQEFTELFPTLEDAQTASAMAQEYNGVARKIMAEGDAGFILRQIKNVNPGSFEKFTDNFLEGVRQIDRDQYNSICEPIIQNVIRWVYNQGHNLGNENLMNSARFFSKTIYGNPNVEELESKKKPSKSNEPDPREAELDRRRNAFEGERFTAATSEIGGQVDTYLSDELEKNIDPTGKMSQYMKNKLIEDIIKGVHDQLANEPTHGRTMKALWDRAKAANYPSELKARIKNTYLARAKQILPTVRARVKQEAFQTGKKPEGKKENGNGNGKSRNIPVGRALSNSNAGGGGKKMPSGRDVDWRNTSERDILDGKYTPKGK